MSGKMDVDEALAKVGGLRRWHLAMFLALGLSSYMPLAGLAMMFVYIAWTPQHYCKFPEGQLLNESIPLDHTNWDQIWSKCKMYQNYTYSNETVGCTDGWTYLSDGYSTMVTEWDLVCDRNYLGELSETISNIGGMVGDFGVSVLTDRLGRRRVHIFGVFLVAILGSCLALVPTYVSFVALRPFVTIALMTSLLPGATLLMELFDSKHRAFAGIGLEFLWVFSFMYLVVLGYFVTKWRTLVLILSLGNFVWLVHIWILPESVWWLVANNREEEAEATLQKMAKYNKVPVHGRLLKSNNELAPKKKEEEALIGKKLAEERLTHHRPMSITESKEEIVPTPVPASVQQLNKRKLPKAGDERLRDLILDPILRKHIIICAMMWFACDLTYYGIILSTPSLAGDRHVNFFLCGLVEVPAYIITFFISKHARRIPTNIFFCAAGFFLILATVVPSHTSSGASLSGLKTAVALTGKFFITGSFAIVILYNRELFPTNLRGTSVGCAAVVGRFGGIGAPLIAYSAKETPWLSNVILGSVTLFVGLLTLMLPETTKTPLPQDMADIHKFFGKKNQNTKGVSSEKLHASNDPVKSNSKL